MIQNVINNTDNKNILTVTADKTLSSYDSLVVCNSVTDITLTLPSIVAGKRCRYYIKNINTGKITITPTGVNIDGKSSIKISNNYDSVIIENNDTMWVSFSSSLYNNGQLHPFLFLQ